MITKHFIERFRERITELEIEREFVKRLLRKCMDICQNSLLDSESVCIHIFDEKELPSWDTENELWVLIREGRLITTWRRDSNHRYSTNERGMRVNKVSYDFV
jgi:hypothetical protein